MRSKVRYTIVIMILSLVLCGCAGAARLTFSENDNGKTVFASAGDSIILTLYENPSTGYRWDMETSGGLIPISNYYTPSGTGRIGAQGTHVWYFIVKDTGTAVISGTYRRPWMPVTDNEQKFVLNIISGKKKGLNPDQVQFFHKKTLQNTFFIPPQRVY